MPLSFFLYLLKVPENLCFVVILRGYRKRKVIFQRSYFKEGTKLSDGIHELIIKKKKIALP